MPPECAATSARHKFDASPTLSAIPTDGLTGSEIADLLAACEITDTDPTITKRHRLYNAFAHEQNRGKTGRAS